MGSNTEKLTSPASLVSGRLARRIAITALGIAVYRLCLQITIPVVDTGVMEEFFRGSGPVVHTSGPFVSSVRFGFLASMSSHSIGQYLGASYLVLLLSGVLPWLRGLRDGGPASRLSFERIIIALAVILLGWQAWQRALWLESVRGPSTDLPLVPEPGWEFRLLAVVTAAGGAAVVIWIAHLITDKGLGNGVAVIIGADILAVLPSMVFGDHRRLAMGVAELRHILYGAIALSLLLALAIAMVTAARQIPLRRREQVSDDSRGEPGGGQPLSLPLRVQAVGTAPVLAAQSLMFMVGAAGITSGLPQEWVSTPPWLINAALIVPLTYLYAVITFSPRDAVSRIQRYGYCLDDPAADGDAVAFVRGIHFRIILYGGLYLGAMVVMPPLLRQVLKVGPQMSGLGGTQVLILAAVSVDIIRQVRAEIAMQKSCGQGADSPPWVQVLTAQTRLETEMAQALLDERGIRSMPVTNRLTSATGTLAFWEASRPRVPCLTIHRGLGGGLASLMAPPEVADQAREALEEMGISSE